MSSPRRYRVRIELEYRVAARDGYQARQKAVALLQGETVAKGDEVAYWILAVTNAETGARVEEDDYEG